MHSKSHKIVFLFPPSVSQSSCFSRAVEVDVLPLTKEVAEPAEGVTSGYSMSIRISKDVWLNFLAVAL